MPVTDLLDPTTTDHTALSNFAALGGQLRISTGPYCNIGCWFCHNEGDVPPPAYRGTAARPRRRQLEADEYGAILEALRTAGLTRWYFTGGEPLAVKMTRPMLEGIPRHDPGELSATLITNATLAREAMPWLSTTHLDKVKVSLHYFSDASLTAIAGTTIKIDQVLAGLDALRAAFPVEINTLLQEQNAHEIDKILRFALAEHLPIQFIELVETGFNTAGKPQALTAETLIARLRALGGTERIVTAGVGQGKRVFTFDGDRVEIIDSRLGRHHVGQCGTCPQRPVCVEGFWSLRLGHDGYAAPCLLRPDLRLDLKPLLGDPAALTDNLARHISGFTEGTL